MDMEELLALARKEPLTAQSIPSCLSTVHTPLQVEVWARLLQTNPDREFTSFLLHGLSQGFRIGFDYGSVSLKPAKSNMASAMDHPDVVAKYLQEECDMGRVVGPLQPAVADHVRQISKFGVIPKGHTPGKWRLIVNLSAPSVSDRIAADLCSLECTSVDRAAALTRTLG